MATRFTDDLFQNTDGSDFIVRRRIPLTMQIFLIFVIPFAVIYFTGWLMSSMGSTIIFAVTLALTLGTLAWFTIYTSARLRDLVLVTEFQNAMLASAAQLSTRFCFITRRDGSIVYVDQGFQKMFQQFQESSDRNVDVLFEGTGVPRELISKIVLMLQHGKSDRILLQLRNPQGSMVQVMLSVDLLPRPKGYFLMRGRDYVEKRGESDVKPAGTAPTTGLEEALGMLSEGILTTNSGGVLTYVNRALEDWLGFAPGELSSGTFKMGHILYQYDGFDAGKPVTTDFDGNVVLQRKDRSLVTLKMRQAALGKPPAISAVLSASGAPLKTSVT